MTDLTLATERPRRAYVVFDVESAVIDDIAHRRYQRMERWTPNDAAPARRGYQRSEDPLQTPRWPFQTIFVAAAMVLIEHDDGNLQVSRFVTLCAPDHDERAIVAGLFQVFSDPPVGADQRPGERRSTTSP